MDQINEQTLNQYIVNYSRQMEHWSNLLINIRHDILSEPAIFGWGGQLNMRDLIQTIDEYEIDQIFGIDQPIEMINSIDEHKMPSKILCSSDTDFIKTICGFDNGCQICIEEFKDNDTLRRIPECSHAFHVGCIDSWFRNKNSCPVCRASVGGITEDILMW